VDTFGRTCIELHELTHLPVALPALTAQQYAYEDPAGQRRRDDCQASGKLNGSNALRTFGDAVRVLICLDALGVGGKERQAVELIKGLASRSDVHCHVVCFETDSFYLPDLTRIGVPVDFLPRRVRWDLGPFRRLSEVIRSYQPAMIHSNGLVSSFYSLPLARRWRIPLVNGSIRNAFPKGGLRWTLEKLLLTASDYRVANSRAGLESRSFSDQHSENVVIYNGFDFNRSAHLTTAAREASVRAVHLTTVGMVAEFNRYKDYRTFIEAARIVSRNRPSVRFVAVGSGETLEACRRAAEGLPTIVFLGKQRHIEEIVATFDICVLCTFVEGLSNSIMEYMALGKPVVATDGGGTRELVVDGETGVLVPQTNPQALASAIERLIAHPESAARMGQAGQGRLRREFSLSRMVDETVALYKRAAAASSEVMFSKNATGA